MVFISMPKRKSKREEAAPAEEDDDVRTRSKTVLGILRDKLRRNRSNGVVFEDRELTRGEKSVTLPAGMRPGEGGKSRKKDATFGEKQGTCKTRTLHWMEEYLSPYEDSLRKSPAVTRKDSDESVDSGFEQTTKTEGSETDSNSSPAQSKALLPSAPSLCQEASDSFQEEPGLPAGPPLYVQRCSLRQGIWSHERRP